jgi:hypothetical protein
MILTATHSFHVVRFFISIATGCSFGCARQIINRQAYTVVFVDGFSTGESALSAENWQLMCAYWVPLVLLVSVEKLFITYADFQARPPLCVCCSFAVAEPGFQILHYQVQKLLSAESVGGQRRRLSNILRAVQIALLAVNVIHFGVTCASASWNAIAANRFSQSAAAFRLGNSTTGKSLFEEGYVESARADYYQGVRLMY